MSNTEKTTGLYKALRSLMAAEFWPRGGRACASEQCLVSTNYYTFLKS